MKMYIQIKMNILEKKPQAPFFVCIERQIFHEECPRPLAKIWERGMLMGTRSGRVHMED